MYVVSKSTKVFSYDLIRRHLSDFRRSAVDAVISVVSKYEYASFFHSDLENSVPVFLHFFGDVGFVECFAVHVYGAAFVVNFDCITAYSEEV